VSVLLSCLMCITKPLNQGLPALAKGQPVVFRAPKHPVWILPHATTRSQLLQRMVCLAYALIALVSTDSVHCWIELSARFHGSRYELCIVCAFQSCLTQNPRYQLSSPPSVMSKYCAISWFELCYICSVFRGEHYIISCHSNNRVLSFRPPEVDRMVYSWLLELHLFYQSWATSTPCPLA